MVKLKEFANVKMPSLCYTCAFLLNAEILHNNFRKCHQWLCVSLAGALSTESLFQRAMPSNLGWMIMQSFIFIWRSELLSLEQVVCFSWATFKGQWNLLGQLMSLPMTDHTPHRWLSATPVFTADHPSVLLWNYWKGVM